MCGRKTILGVAVIASLAGPAQGGIFADFETGTATGFGQLTSSTGVQPWAAPVNGAVITPASGPLGTQVLQLTGNAAFNFGQSSGAALGFDFLAAGLRSEFLANDQLEFDWLPVPNGSPSGFSQLYNVILNSQGGGFQNVDGYSTGDANFNQFYFTGYTGNVHHIVIDYSAYKNAILASGFPDGGGWLQLGIQPNAGDGAPADMYFDNFQFTQIPEPAALGLTTLAAIGLLTRRRHR